MPTVVGSTCWTPILEAAPCGLLVDMFADVEIAAQKCLPKRNKKNGNKS